MGLFTVDPLPNPNSANVATRSTKIRRLAYVLRPVSVLQSDLSSSRVPSEASPLPERGPAFLMPLAAVLVCLDRAELNSACKGSPK